MSAVPGRPQASSHRSAQHEGTPMSTAPLALRSITATPVLVPMKRPLWTSVQALRAAPLLLIDLQTEEGIVGRSYLFCYLGAAAKGIAAIVDDLSTRWRGRALVPATLRKDFADYSRLIGQRGIVSMAGAGIDMAVWDALALAAGQPLVRLLGSEPRAIKAYNSNGLGLIAPQAAADEALQLLESGFTGVKMRLGRATAAADLAAVRAVRQALPADIALMADFNQALTLREALHRGHLLDGEGLAWIEEPIRHDDYAGYAELQRKLTTPIQLGENFAGPKAMAAAIAAGAVGYAMPDAERIGGVSGWMDASALAYAHEIELSSHLFPEVSVHLLAASPAAHWLEFVDWAEPLLQEPMQLQNGMATPNATPGTGLVWDDAAVARYRMD